MRTWFCFLEQSERCISSWLCSVTLVGLLSFDRHCSGLVGW